MLQNSSQRKQNTELLRYALCTGIVSIGMSFNKQSPAALMNMHSARIFLTLQEAKEQYAYSGMDALQAAKTASGVVASCSVLVLGYSRVSCALESVHLAVEAVRVIEQWIRVRKVMKRTAGNKPAKQLAEMHNKAVFCMACAVAEFASFTFRLWPVYLCVHAVKGVYFLHKLLSENPMFYINKLYETCRNAIH
ncbi:hypothetical protein NEMIN01_0888 [Nematocida minor]|uniref:uncharacterized protein n=1 Tax=Nematocida minor TaxID=1912983 RepID=UPI0022206A52|nr:uncharacterized protein NEMIN01_0888 [Nematocida minor]KAI5190103.1 hypothetical protein NEMIN01_0888 [Nematocida minor]